MPITMEDLTIPPQGVDLATLLDDWTWAMPEPLRPVLLTAMGDVFAQGTSGAVCFVDVVGGRITPVAADGDAFRALLRDARFVTEHLFPARIVELRRAGIALGPGQVYSHRQPLALGGEDDVANVEATDVSVHVSLHGQIHRQIEDLPDGTPISDVEIR